MMQRQELKAFSARITAEMLEVATRAKIELQPGDVAIAVHGDFVIANALVAQPRDDPFQEGEKLFLLYLSFPADHKMARKIPTGFYVAERMERQTSPRARLVSLEGRTVAEMPLNIIKTELPPEHAEPYPEPSHQHGAPSGGSAEEPVTTALAKIEQQRESLYRIRVFEGHGTWCFPSAGVWYWTWIVIVVIG
jgi:hypothetical protein